jgi:hypothetical protein
MTVRVVDLIRDVQKYDLFFLFKINLLIFLNYINVKNNFLKIKNIILIYYQIKNTLKNNFYYKILS